ncbi:alpha/beta hydrolase [Parapedobacter lycopersici]|uniref:alpha/beta fold hydrolase n=1 Tax=Parapedobacter lycopersici TaxID=1864939 RepID=UPI0033409E5C
MKLAKFSFFLERKGNKEIQLTLLYDYQNNVLLYPEWQQLFSKMQPATLVIWGENDKFFSKAGALKYGMDLTNIEYAFYPTGHFPLVEFHRQIAEKIDAFLRHHLHRYKVEEAIRKEII